MNQNKNNVSPLLSGHGTGANGGGNDFGERLARIETKIEFMATKEDIQKIKVWVLGGVLGGMASAVAITGAVIKVLENY